MLAVLVSCMSASLLAVTLTEAELLAGTGSGSAVLIPAVLPSVPALLAVAVTVIVGMLLKLAPVYSVRVQVIVASQSRPVPAADAKRSPAPGVSVTVPGCPASDPPPLRRGVSVYTTLAPWATLELAAVLVMDTSAPEVDVTSADVVLLAVLPSGMAGLAGWMPSRAKAAVTGPLTLDRAGTVSTEADAPLARVPVRVQVTLPLLSG